MREFRINIRMENDAVQTHEDVAGIVQELMTKIRDTHSQSGCVRDVNGNIVGVWEFRS